jgi:predicted MFS family arabinose efflux permease
VRPVLLVSLLVGATQTARGSFVGIWAVQALGASSLQLGITFSCAALLAAVTAYAAGHVSDGIGRKPIMLAAAGIQVLVSLALVQVGQRVGLGLVLVVVAGAAEAMVLATDQALLTDVADPGRRDEAFAAGRALSNLGFALGPLLGAGLVYLGWRALFAGCAVLGAIALLATWRLIPMRGAHAPAAPPTRRSWRVIGGDRVFLLVLGATFLAALVYVTYETVLPISLTQSHGVSPSAWGVLLVINPLLVALLQVRVSAAGRRIPAGMRLALAMAMMGLPFLLLSRTAALAAVALMLAVFVLGEMLWAPTAQAAVARLAPGDLRGAYFGAFATTFPVAFAISPLVCLQVRAARGDAAMWLVVAVLALAAAVAYLAAARAGGGPHAGGEVGAAASVDPAAPGA